MIAEKFLTRRRTHLFLMSALGFLVVFGAILAYCIGLGISNIGFGKFRLFVTTLLGGFLLLGSFVVHRKAVADIQKSRRAYWKTVLFVVASIIVGPLMTVIILDQMIGLFLCASSPTPILVLAPNNKISYQTSEFQFNAETNALGFRDHEVVLQGKSKFRVLAIGDSFTYGWGVDAADSWRKVVEMRLTDAGQNAEVLNLGCPGAGVDAYAEVAERAVPLLEPDLVIVAILQGIDLKLQEMGSTTDRLFHLKIDENRRITPTWAPRVVPHFYELRRRLTANRPRVQSADEIREEWQRMATAMPSRLTPAEMTRFDGLDPEVVAMLRSGDLNPWEVYFALKYPDYVSFTLHPERVEVQNACARMASSLERIKNACAKANVKMMILTVTPAWYVSPQALISKRRVGFQLDETALGSDAPDEMIRSACRMAGLDCYSFTNRFRTVGEKRKWFFDFDGMFNAEGHSLYGAEVSKLLLSFSK